MPLKYSTSRELISKVTKPATIWLSLVVLGTTLATAISAAPIQAQQSSAADATERLLRLKAKQEGRIFVPLKDKNLSPTERLLLLKARQEAFPVVVEKGERTVLVRGQGAGSWHENDAALSRQEALRDALRNAVEQASGLAIESRSQVENYELVQEILVTKSQGFVKRYRIIEEKRDGPLYRLEIEALILTQPLIKTLKETTNNDKNTLKEAQKTSQDFPLPPKEPSKN